MATFKLDKRIATYSKNLAKESKSSPTKKSRPNNDEAAAMLLLGRKEKSDVTTEFVHLEMRGGCAWRRGIDYNDLLSKSIKWMKEGIVVTGMMMVTSEIQREFYVTPKLKRTWDTDSDAGEDIKHCPFLIAFPRKIEGWEPGKEVEDEWGPYHEALEMRVVLK